MRHRKKLVITLAVLSVFTVGLYVYLFVNIPEKISIDNNHVLVVHHPLSYILDKKPKKEIDNNNKEVLVYTLYNTAAFKTLEIKVYKEFNKSMGDFVKEAKSDSMMYELTDYKNNMSDTSLLWRVDSVFDLYYLVRIIKSRDFTVVAEWNGSIFERKSFKKNEEIIKNIHLKEVQK